MTPEERAEEMYPDIEDPHEFDTPRWELRRAYLAGFTTAHDLAAQECAAKDAEIARLKALL